MSIAARKRKLDASWRRSGGGEALATLASTRPRSGPSQCPRPAMLARARLRASRRARPARRRRRRRCSPFRRAIAGPIQVATTSSQSWPARRTASTALLQVRLNLSGLSRIAARGPQPAARTAAAAAAAAGALRLAAARVRPPHAVLAACRTTLCAVQVARATVPLTQATSESGWSRTDSKSESGQLPGRRFGARGGWVLGAGLLLLPCVWGEGRRCACSGSKRRWLSWGRGMAVPGPRGPHRTSPIQPPTPRSIGT